MPVSKNNAELSAINNLDDLKAEISRVRFRVKKQEQELAERWKKVPKESLKAGVGILIPFFLNNKVAASSWRLVRDSFGFLTGRKSADGQSKLKDMWKDTRRIGVFTLLKGVFGVLKKR